MTAPQPPSREIGKAFEKSDEMTRWSGYIKDWIYSRRPERCTEDDLRVAALWSCNDDEDFRWKFRIVLLHLMSTGHLRKTNWRSDGYITPFKEGFFKVEMFSGL